MFNHLNVGKHIYGQTFAAKDVFMVKVPGARLGDGLTSAELFRILGDSQDLKDHTMGT
jgi:hypothetical protein